MKHSNAVANGPQRKTFAKGATIFKEGDKADAAYILESGSVEIFKMVGGRRIELGTVRSWGIFGELGLIDDRPRMAAAYAAQESVCMVVSKEAVAGLLDGAPEGLHVLIASLVQIIRTAGEELAEARFHCWKCAARPAEGRRNYTVGPASPPAFAAERRICKHSGSAGTPAGRSVRGNAS